MTGFVLAIGQCFGCKQNFSFNPVRVPSVIVNGSKEPICQECVARANPLRKANGLKPIVPLPGAYEECEEDELG